MSNSKSNLCRNCGKPAVYAGGDFAANPKEGCKCDSSQDLPLEICAVCKRVIGSRHQGTITQYIFGADQCSCERPTPVSRTANGFNQSATEERFDDDVDEDELELDENKFPVSRYKPIAILGRGASGIVYMCRDRLLQNRVAVKVLHELTAEQLIAFQDEARATSKLNHRNVVKVLDFGATGNGVPYMVMSYVPGISLEVFLERNKRVEIQTALQIISGVCEALNHIHKHKMFHRDIKPSNIMLAENAGRLEIILIDLGIAKVKEATGSVTSYQGRTMAGTPAYMPPDTVIGYEYTVRSEIYSVACVLFELLTGKPPFVCTTALETINLHATQQPCSLQQSAELAFPASLEKIVARCLDKSPELRFSDMNELLTALAQVSTSGDASAINEQQASGINRKAAFVGVALLIACCLVIVLIAGPILSHADVREKKLENTHTYTSSHNYLTATSFSPTSSRKSNEKLPERLREQMTLSDADLERMLNDSSDGLILQSKKITRQQMRQLMSMRTISHLNLTCCDLEDGAVNEICTQKTLIYLRLKECSNVTDHSVEMLKSLKMLRFLDVQGCRGVTGVGLRTAVQSFPQIDDISIGDTGILCRDLGVLERLKRLKRLDLARMRDLTDDNLKTILPRLHLQELNLAYNNEISEKCCSLLVKCGIKRVRLTGCNTDNFSPSAIEELKSKMTVAWHEYDNIDILHDSAHGFFRDE